MAEENCTICGCAIGEDSLCLELWLRVPNEEEIRQALALVSESVADALRVKPQVRIHEGYVTPPERFCSFSCLSLYAVTRWRQAEAIKSATDDLPPVDPSYN